MDNDLKIGGINGLGSDLTALQSLKHIICLTPRMLTESEIKLLRQSKVEIAQRVGELSKLSGGSNWFLRRQLERRFGVLPEWATEKLSCATEQEQETWREAILTAPTLEAVFNSD